MHIHANWNLADESVTMTRIGLKAGRSVGKVRMGVSRTQSDGVTCLGGGCQGVLSAGHSLKGGQPSTMPWPAEQRPLQP